MRTLEITPLGQRRRERELAQGRALPVFGVELIQAVASVTNDLPKG